jgi:O-acetyl-ADP-ribose deacetylase (regulator of RNase III)
MELAEAKGAKYISFPSISTGIYGYPVEQAAPIALREVIKHLKREDTKVQKAIFVLFDDQTLQAYSRALRSLIPPD